MKIPKRIGAYIISAIGLFVLGIALVYVFFYHVIFYSLGVPLLVLVGGILVFVTFKLILFFIRYKDVPEEGDAMLLFSKEEREKILTGKKTQKIYLDNVAHIKRTSLVEAKTNIANKEPFALLKIVRIDETTLKELTNEDALREGYENRKQLLKYLRKLDKDLGEERSVTMVRFRVKGD
jgi:hypothetical protein